MDLPTEAQWEYACRTRMIMALNSGYNLTNVNIDTHVGEVGRYLSNGWNGYKQTGDTSVASAKVGSYLEHSRDSYRMAGGLKSRYSMGGGRGHRIARQGKSGANRTEWFILRAVFSPQQIKERKD